MIEHSESKSTVMAAQLLAVLIVAASLSSNLGHSMEQEELFTILPEIVWDALSGASDADLQPWVLKTLLTVLKDRAGSDHWCCHHGSVLEPVHPIINQNGEVVGWNSAACPITQLGCCNGYMKVANHCMTFEQQKQFATAIATAGVVLGPDGQKELLDTIMKGGMVGK